MIKYVQLLAAMMVALFTTSAMAFSPPPSPKPVGSIVDLVGVLSPADMHRLNMQLRQINQSTGNEIGLLIVPSLNGENIRDVGIATARAWGVGKRDVDNGVMVIWSRGDRQVGIETGKGVEGDLTDLQCNDIIRNVVSPNFKQRRFVEGLSQGFAAINTAVADHHAAIAERDRKANEAVRSTPQADSHSTSTERHDSGCDISGAPGTRTDLLFAFLVVFALSMATAFLRRRVRKQRLANVQEDLEMAVEEKRQTVARLRAEFDAKVAALRSSQEQTPVGPTDNK